MRRSLALLRKSLGSRERAPPPMRFAADAKPRRFIMRRFLLTGSALATIVAIPAMASARVYAADVYPAPGAAVVNPPAVVAAPMVESQVYLAPAQTYVAPGMEYQDQPIIINGQRYYRDCWWDWGRRKCELKPWW